MNRLLDRCTWTLALLLVVSGPAIVLADDPWRMEAAGALLAVMTVLNLGFLLAPPAAARHWLLRLPVAALMLPAMGVMTICLAGATMEAVQGRDDGFRVWIIAPTLLVLCAYLSTLARLAAVRTPLAHLVRPTPREDTPAERSRAAAGRR